MSNFSYYNNLAKIVGQGNFFHYFSVSSTIQYSKYLANFKPRKENFFYETEKFGTIIASLYCGSCAKKKPPPNRQRQKQYKDYDSQIHLIGPRNFSATPKSFKLLRLASIFFNVVRKVAQKIRSIAKIRYKFDFHKFIFHSSHFFSFRQ